jgi:hypothetical protein
VPTRRRCAVQRVALAIDIVQSEQGQDGACRAGDYIQPLIPLDPFTGQQPRPPHRIGQQGGIIQETGGAREGIDGRAEASGRPDRGILESAVAGQEQGLA